MMRTLSHLVGIDVTGSMVIEDLTHFAVGGGSVGPAGEQGPPGPAGADGAQGPAGPQGDIGATGPQGETGATGGTGPQGIQGPAGDAGPQGIQGVQGSPGADGAQGPAGADSTVPGPAGDTGPQGPAGADGAQGIQGIQGIQGEPGTDVPVGIIAMWGGLLVNIPANWHLCDGTTGTPDLRGLFIKGALAGVDPGATGGSATHGHTSTQPTAAGESAHTHGYTQVVNHVHVQSLPTSQTGSQSSGTRDTSTTGTGADALSTANPTGGVASGTTAGGASHTHTLSGAAVDTVNSEPAYYSLAYIQKVA